MELSLGVTGAGSPTAVGSARWGGVTAADARVLQIHAPAGHGKALSDATGGWTKRAIRMEEAKTDSAIEQAATQSEYAQQLVTFANGGAMAKPRKLPPPARG